MQLLRDIVAWLFGRANTDEATPPPVEAIEAAELAGESEHIDRLIDIILKHEGGFQRWKSDRGNYHHGELLGTNYGIIPDRLAEWRGVKRVRLDDIKTLTRHEAREIYRHYYYKRPKMHLLPDPVEAVIFDQGVNSGPSRGVKVLQKTLNKAGFACAVDGRIGPETVKQAYAAWRAMGGYLINAIVDERISWYNAIIAGRPSQAVFRKGWHNRANSFRVTV